ncbi:T9SS type A sorting domain-containing protein [Taibaiella chishuiensis]|uniref:T9SS type A sorting domain-containing protein n=1 Tax=Taibaiella chishuiensis TaxID=1434707 RepID=UPI0015E63D08|nr:T9SS type A sorting domain-containing protein [Taibaiella chishuiensis]
MSTCATVGAAILTTAKDNDFYTVPGGYAELRAGSTAAIQVNMPSMGLNYSTGSKADIAIYDISGRCLQTTSLPVSGNTFSADVAMPAAPAGMYLVTVNGTGLLEHFKVLKR